MKIHTFTTEELTYLTNYLLTIANGNLPRAQRRNVERVANKVAPPRSYVHLKPADLFMVKSYCLVGLDMMAMKLDQVEKPEDKAHVEKVSKTMMSILTKLGEKGFEDEGEDDLATVEGVATDEQRSSPSIDTHTEDALHVEAQAVSG